MNIKDIPGTLDELKGWTTNFEETYITWAHTNCQVGTHTLDFILNRVPVCFGSSVRSFAREIVVSLLEDRTRNAFGLPEPSKLAQVVLHWVMSTIAFVNRYLSLPRIKPREYTASKVPMQVFIQAEKNGTLPRLHPLKSQ